MRSQHSAPDMSSERCQRKENNNERSIHISSSLLDNIFPLSILCQGFLKTTSRPNLANGDMRCVHCICSQGMAKSDSKSGAMSNMKRTRASSETHVSFRSQIQLSKGFFVFRGKHVGSSLQSANQKTIQLHIASFVEGRF